MIKINKKKIFVIVCIIIILFCVLKSFARTSLFLAIDDGDCKKVENIITTYPSLLNSQQYGILGCIIGIDNKIDTPLVRACDKNQIEVAKLLMELGADVNKPSLRSVRYPIIETLKRKNYELAWLLIEKGADLSVIDDYKTNVPSSILINSDTQLDAEQQFEIMKYYIENCCPDNCEAFYSKEVSMLGEAVRINNVLIVDYFIENKIFDINDIVDSETRSTALIYLIKSEIEYGDYYSEKYYRDLLGVCKTLLKHNADKTIKDIYGKTAFDYAVELGNQKLLEILS